MRSHDKQLAELRMPRQAYIKFDPSALEFLPLDCSRRMHFAGSVTSRGGATLIRAK